MITDTDFAEFVRRASRSAIFGPGMLWRKLGPQAEDLRRLVGDEFPVVLIPLGQDPPNMGSAVRYTVTPKHRGAHGFLKISAEGGDHQLKSVLAFCLLDPASREALGHLVETTQSPAGEFARLPAKFRIFIGGFPTLGRIVVSDVLEVAVGPLLSAWDLWRVTRPEDREGLADPGCPLCAARTPAP